MTVLAQKLVELGWYPTVAIADVAITAGEVYRDANNEIRYGRGAGIVANVAEATAATVASLPLKHDHDGRNNH